MNRPSSIFDTLVDRDFFPVWLNNQGLIGQIVEIGTFRGEYAAHLCQHYAGMVTTIDPFEGETEAYRDGCVANLDMEQVFEEAMERLRPWTSTGRCRLIRGFSVKEARWIPLESLQAVYCDGNHQGEAVVADIAAWWPKIKPGGVLGGHDFYTRTDKLQVADVANAVLDFAEQLGVRPWITPDTSWWLFKE